MMRFNCWISRKEYLQKWFAVLPEAYENIQVWISRNSFKSFNRRLMSTTVTRGWENTRNSTKECLQAWRWAQCFFFYMFHILISCIIVMVYRMNYCIGSTIFEIFFPETRWVRLAMNASLEGRGREFETAPDQVLFAPQALLDLAISPRENCFYLHRHIMDCRREHNPS